MTATRCAFGGEAQRDLAADVAGAARHQSDLSLQTKVHGHTFTSLPFGLGRLDQAEQAFGRYGKLVDLDAERRQRIGDGVGDRRRRADGAALAHAAEAAERGRQFGFKMHHRHRRHLAGRRHQIIDQARGVDLALVVVDDFFQKRGADALGDAAMHLAVDDQRVDQSAAVFGDHVARQPALRRSAGSSSTAAMCVADVVVPNIGS